MKRSTPSRHAYGDFPQLTNAIADYKAHRAALARTTLTTAIAAGRQALLALEARRAIDLLGKVGTSVEYCEKDLQADWKRLLEEATRAAKIKRGSTENLPIVVKGGGLSIKSIQRDRSRRYRGGGRGDRPVQAVRAGGNNVSATQRRTLR